MAYQSPIAHMAPQSPITHMAPQTPIASMAYQSPFTNTMADIGQPVSSQPQVCVFAYLPKGQG